MSEVGFATVVENGAAVPAVLWNDQVVTLTAVAACTEPATETPGSVRALLPELDRWTDRVVSARDAELPWRAGENVTFLPPILDPSAVYCAGGNYYDHLEEMGTADVFKSDLSCFHFLTAPSAMVGHRTPVRRPPHCMKLDWEIELAAIIGRRADNVPVQRALDHVAGYTVANDVSARDHLDRPNSALGIDWLRHKSYATLLPIGPAVVPARLVGDPSGLSLRLRVDGEIRQDSTTEQMIFSVQEQIAALSAVSPLLPGDILLTGTPAGTAAAHDRYLDDGAVMSADIPGVGRLENTVAGPRQR